jgi:AcrR family transcriptional regulator
MEVSKKELKENDKRRLLLESALIVFSKLGYHNARIEDIIKHAGVGKGTFYLYYKNKEELVFNSLAAVFIEIKQTLDWVEEQVGEIPLHNLFEYEANLLVKSFDKHRDISRFIFREGKSVSPSVKKLIDDFFKEIRIMAENTYALGGASGLMNIVNPEIAAICVIGGVMNLYETWLEQKMDSDLDASISAAVEFYNAALGVKF